MKTRRLVLLATFAVSLLLIAVFGTILVQKMLTSYGSTTGGFASKRQVLSLWKAAKYQEAYDVCAASLQKRPVDDFFLLYGGFSAFYAGISKIDDEERRNLIDSSIACLRKAQLLRGAPLRAETAYILGKDYYQLGYYYLDKSVDSLESARKLGYRATDIDEYLGMGYLNLGKYDLAILAFTRALSLKKTDQLYIAAATALQKAGRNEDAINFLQDAIVATSDVLTEEKARLMTGDVMMSMKRYDAAEAEYRSVIEKDADSADAHYGLGLVLEAKGDAVQARSEWRKAVRIEPMHQGARLKLSQK